MLRYDVNDPILGHLNAVLQNQFGEFVESQIHHSVVRQIRDANQLQCANIPESGQTVEETVVQHAGVDHQMPHGLSGG